ncbi:hypothetical protein SAMN04488514_102361 [Kriegella aquimaris]|uniref:Uncharacterized protein n=1 Tax=Kriegella aquimaris TaxID=192904 RepID=A0A1G9M5D1_9FLAO|nr:hypothetical protein SAMN04488514_102361 [Kriegella aquimaris]
MLLLLFLGNMTIFGQKSQESQHRIKKAQFPTISIDTLFKAVNDSELKKVRYYKAVDTARTTYTLKFKMQRLHYQMHFYSKGKLLKVGFGIKEVDVPSDTYAAMQHYLQNRFKNVKIRRMYQEYHIISEEKAQSTIKNAFQNLMLPTNQYRLLIMGKNELGRQAYEAKFDAEGELNAFTEALPSNYDRVLY